MTQYSETLEFLTSLDLVLDLTVDNIISIRAGAGPKQTGDEGAVASFCFDENGAFIILSIYIDEVDEDEEVDDIYDYDNDDLVDSEDEDDDDF